MKPIQTLLSAFSRLYPWDVDASEELTDSLSYLGSSHDAETVVRAGFGVGIVVFILPVFPLLFLFPTPAVVFIMAFLAVAATHVVQILPVMAAKQQRMEALGQAPDLVGRIVLRMKIQPSMERAVRFAAETGDDPLSSSLNDHIQQTRGTPKSELLTFANEWTTYFPSIRRSSHLLNTAQDATENKRDRTLDRALTAILNGTRDQMAAFTTAIRGPTTGLYAFCVMLPIALISLTPAVSAAGIPIAIEAFVVFYDIILPCVIVLVGGWLLTRRPVAFPPPDVTRSHPDADTDSHWLIPTGIAVGAGGLTFGGALLLGLSALAPVSAVGMAIGVFLRRFYKPVVEVRNYVRDIEEHLVDALYIIGRQVDDNEAVESAIKTVGDRLPAPTDEVFRQAADRQHRLHLTVEQAFLGDYGVLRNIPSSRARESAQLLAIAADEGQPAGTTIVSLADHIEELQEVERRTKQQLSSITGTLENTASFYAPLVGGATVALANAMTGQNVTLSTLADSAQPFQTELLGVVVGIYIILLCFLLQPFSIGLKNGLDRPLIGYRIGNSLIVAIPLYVSAIYFVELLLL